MATNKENLPFSKRYGYEPAEVPFQVDNIDLVLRVELWNAFYVFIYDPMLEAERYSQDSFRTVHRILWMHFFKKPFDEFPGYDTLFRDFVKSYVSNAVWNTVYDFFEFLFATIRDKREYHCEDFVDYINIKLHSSNSAYTIINDKFVPVTNKFEVDEIKLLQETAKVYNLDGIQEHLNSAIDLLSKKPNPEYRNSIKESISMVEAITRIIEPTENSLGKALKKLEKNEKISPQLKAGFEQLYAYTNGKDGIRHAIMEEKSIGLEDARFFLISCSAFTNYLIEKAKQQNLIKS